MRLNWNKDDREGRFVLQNERCRLAKVRAVDFMLKLFQGRL